MSLKYRTVIAVTDTDVKILQARMRRGVPVPFHSFVKPRQNASEDVLPAALLEGLSAPGSRAGHIILLVPRRQVLVRQVRLPSHSGQEIQRMVDLQVSHLTPFTREDIVTCHSILDRDPDGHARVLIQAVQKDIVFGYLRLLSDRKLSCQRVILSSSGISAWYKTNMCSRQDKGRVAAVLDVDRRGSELCFMQDDSLLFSRYLAFGHEVERPEEAEVFLSQILLTMEAYRREAMGNPVSRFIVVSDAEFGRRLKELLGKHLEGVPDIELVSARQQALDKHKKNHPGLFSGAVSWTALLGGISESFSKEANLIPREIIQIKSSTVRRREMTRFMIVLLGTLGILWGAFNLDNFQKEKTLAQFKAALKDQQVEVKRAQENIQAVEALQNKLLSRTVLVDILQGLYGKVPEAIALRSLQLDPNGTIILLGFGESRSAVNQFHNNLVSSAMFQKVALEYATERKRFKEEYVEFKILCQLSGDEKGAQ